MASFRFNSRYLYLFIFLAFIFLLFIHYNRFSPDTQEPRRDKSHIYLALDSLKLSAQVNQTGDVIRHIHQTWKSLHLPPRFQTYSSSWKHCYPQWEHSLWDDADNREFIRNKFPWFLESYDEFPSNIYRADAIRYFLMFTYGGLYTDLDTECLHPFEHLLTNRSLVFGGMEGEYVTSYQGWYIQNSFFYSRPGHPFWLEVIREIVIIGEGLQAEYVTGPIMLTNLMKKLQEIYKDEWTIYPPNYFNPFSWIYNSHPLPAACKTLNVMNDKELYTCREYFRRLPNTYVVQYHSQTWSHGVIL